MHGSFLSINNLQITRAHHSVIIYLFYLALNNHSLTIDNFTNGPRQFLVIRERFM